MSSNPAQSALAACRYLMRPIIRLLLRCGVTWKDFAQTCKTVYVDVASQDYGVHRRPTNVSRIAILTGINRREVGRLRDLLDNEALPDSVTLSNASRVLSAWYQDADFTDKKGKPMDLVPDGEGSSFAELLRRYAGDIPPSAMLWELKHVGAVTDTKEGKLRVLTRYYMPAKLDPDSILRFGEVLQDLGSAVFHNISRKDDEPARFEGRAHNLNIDPAAADKFRKLIAERGEEFLEEIDEWLTAHEITPSKASRTGKRARLGIGIYLIEDIRRRGKT